MSPATPSVSVAMTTFNGARYVREQLQSLVDQSCPPHEVVVSDDGSSDGTASVLREFAAEHGGLVRTVGGTHLGLRGNVERVLTACTGDVVALADQDDVWRRGKVCAITEAFRDPAVSLWFSDADLIDGDGSALGGTAWRSVHLDAGAIERIEAGEGLPRLIHGQTVTGATMAFRRDVLQVALPLPADAGGPGGAFLHDGWIAVLASLLGTTRTDATPHISYRQHPDQFTSMSLANPVAPERGGPRRMSTASALALEQRRVDLVLGRLSARARLESCRPGDIAWLAGKQALLNARTAPPGLRRIRGILEQVVRGGYSRHGLGWRAVTVDLLGIRPSGHEPPAGDRAR